MIHLAVPWQQTSRDRVFFISWGGNQTPHIRQPHHIGFYRTFVDISLFKCLECCNSHFPQLSSIDEGVDHRLLIQLACDVILHSANGMLYNLVAVWTVWRYSDPSAFREVQHTIPAVNLLIRYICLDADVVQNQPRLLTSCFLLKLLQ